MSALQLTGISGDAHIRLGVLSTTGAFLSSAVFCTVQASGQLRGGYKLLSSQGYLDFSAHAALSAASAELKSGLTVVLAVQAELRTGIELSARATVFLAVQAELRTGIELSARATVAGRATLHLGIALGGSPPTFGLRVQRLGDQLLAMVTAHPAVVRLAWAWNGAPLTAVVGELLNPNQGMPLILKIPGFVSPNDPITNVITVQAWQEANGRTSARATATIEIKPTASGFLKPPKSATAIQIRNWTINARDLTRIEWDWGDDEPAMVEVSAYVRPVTVTNTRQIKTIRLAVMDSTTRFLLAESIGIKIFKLNRNSEPVYFGVARYLNGQSGPELFTSPILINCGVEEAQAPPVQNNTPQTVIEQNISQATGMSQSQINEILQTALNRIKWVIARGGLVDLEQFGQFSAVWSTPITRIDPITGKVTQTPSHRTARFSFNSAFLSNQP